MTLTVCQTGIAKTLTAMSPDSRIKVEVSDDNDQPVYRVFYQNKPVIQSSKLGLYFKESPDFLNGFNIQSTATASHDETWQQPWGERREVQDQHNQLSVQLKRNKAPFNTYTLKFKVFNDGIGFRYEVPKQPGINQVEIINEATEFVLPNSSQSEAWWIGAKQFNRYEHIYQKSKLAEIDRANTPFTARLANGMHLSIHEAALIDYAGMTLDQQQPGVFKANLTPWFDGVAVKTQTDFKSPWRTIQIAPQAIGLLNSDLILNLNEPNKLGDVSWVNPGKYVGIWWGMHIGTHTWGSGDKHGATTELTKNYMDFAAKYGFDGVLVEGWNTGWDGDWAANGEIFSFTQAYPDFDLTQISEYGKKVGVKLIGHHETSGHASNYHNQMADAYDLYEKHGVEQIKTGYVASAGNITRIDENGFERKEWHDGQFMVGEYLKSVTEAAKRKISINTHEPVKDTGLRRTYPNWISREGARGQEFNAWGQPPNPPEHTVMLTYTRMLSGPMDFTPGIFDLTFNDKREADIGGLQDDLQAAKRYENRIPTTLAKQLALYVVLYSPIQMVPDLPENYEAKPDAFQFIVDVPTDWEKSEAIAGEVGEYVVFARQERGGEDWYLGAITDANARKVSINLDFLKAGETYQAQIYRDGKEADWQTNPYDLIIENKPVKKGDSLILPLATSGGAAIRFKKL